MKGKVLVIGGAGFIGSHTADELFKRGYKIRILDNLSPKTHFGRWPKYLSPKFEKIKGNVKDRKILEKSLEGVDFVIHLAAIMDLMPDYSVFFDTNVTSTALLYEIIVAKKLPIKKIVVASSQFVYGEGRWRCKKHGEIFPKQRVNESLTQKRWDPVCPLGGEKIKPLLLEETHQDPPNQYAISKYTQELIALKLGRLNSIPSVAMRYSIVHGPRQSLKNAYSGALRIFTLQLLNNKPLSIYEDGLSQRDYVSVYDVARANADVLENPRADFENFNVGSGKAYTVLELAHMVAQTLGKDWGFKPTGEFRVGDIRHAVSSIAKLEKLGWKVRDKEEEIVKEYVNWVKEQKLDQDYLSLAEAQMKALGVVKKAAL
ncbi:NAD-dependent epimerase/dehydratase family protein [Candidatus Daviesbacteria bacterium]|nr:NAD-dependent epimerase/dehydratase family protein [Candidatus Daviesbacteria bacterium]